MAPPKKRNNRRNTKKRKPRSTKWKETPTLRVVLHDAQTGWTINNNSLVEARDAIVFRLSECVEFLKYTAIYDQFRIDKVQVRFIPCMAEMVTKPYDDATSGTTSYEIPLFTTAIDYDDEATPASRLELAGRSKSRTVKATKAITWNFIPRRLVQVYRSTSTTGYKIDTTKDFIDCAQNDIPHYGLKYALATAGPNNAYVYRVVIKYFVSFKQRRH